MLRHKKPRTAQKSTFEFNFNDLSPFIHTISMTSRCQQQSSDKYIIVISIPHLQCSFVMLIQKINFSKYFFNLLKTSSQQHRRFSIDFSVWIKFILISWSLSRKRQSSSWNESIDNGRSMITSEGREETLIHKHDTDEKIFIEDVEERGR